MKSGIEIVTTPTAIEIIKQHLIDNGFDGLCNSHLDCGCEISDLQPCEDDFSQCRPGYKYKDPNEEYDFLIIEELQEGNIEAACLQRLRKLIRKKSAITYSVPCFGIELIKKTGYAFLELFLHRTRKLHALRCSQALARYPDSRNGSECPATH